MGFFSKLFTGEGDDVPEWASFFSGRQYHEFIANVASYFEDQGVAIQIEDGVVTAVSDTPQPDGESDADDGFGQLGLHNLSQMCAQVEEHEWGEIIGNHFSSLEQTRREAEALDADLKDFDKVKHLLAVRFFPLGYVDETKMQLIHRVDLAGTTTALVFDLPTAVRSVNRSESEGWNKTDEELFAIGLENLRRSDEPPEISVHQLDDAGDLCTIGGDSFMTATHALLLDEKSGFLGPHGGLVAIPHRHIVLCHPIRDLRVIPALQRMLQIARGMFVEGPGSITDQLYWYHRGQWTHIPSEVQDDAMSVNPPESFVEMMNDLSEHGGSGSARGMF